MGGLQVQRDFTLRSDLVTAPLPQITGTAAVPSSVDVFVDGTKAYSQDVAPGPYSLTNLPLIAQNGVAQVVVRDATGREVDTSLNLFDPGRLLAPGLVDFSVETGLARLNYGSVSDDYGRAPIGSASLRGSFSDWFTGEVHAEGGGGLANAGAGALTRFGPYGILTTALSGSRYGDHIGLQAYGSYEWQSRWLSVQVGSQRTFGTSLDLASIAQRHVLPTRAVSSVAAAGLLPEWAMRPPKALDRASIGAPLPFGKGTVSVGMINLRDADWRPSRIATVSLAYSLPCDASLFVTGFKDFANRRASGIYAGLSMPLGNGISATAGYSDRAGSQGFTTAAQKSQPYQDGTYGWRVDDTEGADPVRQAAGTYRTGYGQVGASIQQIGHSAAAQGQFDGSVAVMKDGIAVGNRSDQSFAVVDTGVPGVPILQDNRHCGRHERTWKISGCGSPALRAQQDLDRPEFASRQCGCVANRRGCRTPGSRRCARRLFDQRECARSRRRVGRCGREAARHGAEGKAGRRGVLRDRLRRARLHQGLGGCQHGCRGLRRGGVSGELPVSAGSRKTGSHQSRDLPMTGRWLWDIGLALFALSSATIPVAAQSCSASASDV